MQEPVYMETPEQRPRIDYLSDPIFQRLQYEIRAAYEEGWRDGGGDPLRSSYDREPVGWRAKWLTSQARAFLVANGIQTGLVKWK